MEMKEVERRKSELALETPFDMMISVKIAESISIECLTSLRPLESNLFRRFLDKNDWERCESSRESKTSREPDPS